MRISPRGRIDVWPNATDDARRVRPSDGPSRDPFLRGTSRCGARRSYGRIGRSGDLVAPRAPPRAPPPREQLEIRPGAARFDDLVELVGLARVLALARGEQVHL